MAIAPAESPVTQGLRSLEVRWILPRPLQPAVAGWFGRFPAETVSRQDAYLSYARWLSWHQEPRVTEAPARYRPRSG